MADSEGAPGISPHGLDIGQSGGVATGRQKTALARGCFLNLSGRCWRLAWITVSRGYRCARNGPVSRLGASPRFLRCISRLQARSYLFRVYIV